MRARLYGLANTVSAANGTVTVRIATGGRIRAPAAKNIVNATKTSRLAVPMSGSLRIRIAMMPTGTHSGNNP